MSTATTGSASMANPATATTISVTMNGSFTADTSASGDFGIFQWGYSDVQEHSSSTVGTNPNLAGNFSAASTIDSDRTYKRRARWWSDFDLVYSNGSTITSKTNAKSLLVGVLSSSAITASTANLACTYNPNTNESSASVKMQYRVYGDTTWIDAPGGSDSASGYSATIVERALTGLTGSTTYEYKMTGTRNTNNGAAFNSSTGSFTTLASSPTATTVAATNIGPAVATLNGTVNPNTETDVEYRFAYGTVPATYPNTTTWTSLGFSDSSSHAVSANISSLSTTTTYYFRIEVRWNSGTETTNGSELSFTTAASAVAARIMPSVYQFERKYGVAVAPSSGSQSDTSIDFCVEVPSATNSDKFLSAAIPWIAGDVLVSKDGCQSDGTTAGFSNIGTLPTRIGSTQLYTLTLTATEMQAATILVLLTDVSGGPLWRDTLLVIRTKQHLGSVTVDASQIGTNTDAVTYTGKGTGKGISAVGGATSTGDIGGVLASHVIRKSTAQAGAASTITLDASASATDDFYNQSVLMIISGTGSGQFRTISDYVGSTKVATVDRAWTTNPSSDSVFFIQPAFGIWNATPAAELSAVPTATSSYADMLQYVFERFAHKIDMTATTQTLYKANSSTQLSSRSASDNGTTQTLGKIS